MNHDEVPIDEIIHQINLARNMPKLFSKVLEGYLPYYKGTVFRYPGMTGIQTNEGDKAVKEAIKFLNSQKALSELTSDHSLNSIAKDYTTLISSCKTFEEVEEKGDLDSLIDKYGSINGSFAQSVEFGTSNAQMIVANLIIDDGDESRGNRGYIFGEKYHIIGANYITHPQLRTATVILFCQEFISNSKSVPTEEVEEKTSNVKTITKRPSKIIQITNEEEIGKITDDDFDEGVVKVEKEIETITKGKKKTKIVTTYKTMKDGTKKTEKKTYEIN